MRNIKTYIRKEFDSIPHRPKEEMLAELGIAPKSTKKQFRRISCARLMPAVAVCIVLFMLGVTFAFAAGNGEFAEQIKEYVGIQPSKTQKNEESEHNTTQNNIIFSDGIADKGGFVTDYDEIAKRIGFSFYYPTECVDSALTPYVSYNENGKIQIIYNAEIMYFWIEPSTENEIPQNASVYKSHNTDFYIRESDGFEQSKFDNYFVCGNIDGRRYSFYADSETIAVKVIDSLKKAE